MKDKSCMKGYCQPLPAGETESEMSCRGRCLRIGSEAFGLIKKIFISGQCQFRMGASERKTISRLIRAGLVASHRCQGCGRASYSLTLAGRASYVASELGLSYSQLCYLACVRAATYRSTATGKVEFCAKDVNSAFSALYLSASPVVARKQLARKGFLARRTWHVSETTARFEHVERYSKIIDDLYLCMKKAPKKPLQSIPYPLPVGAWGDFVTSTGMSPADLKYGQPTF